MLSVAVHRGSIGRVPASQQIGTRQAIAQSLKANGACNPCPHKGLMRLATRCNASGPQAAIKVSLLAASTQLKPCLIRTTVQYCCAKVVLQFHAGCCHIMVKLHMRWWAQERELSHSHSNMAVLEHGRREEASSSARTVQSYDMQKVPSMTSPFAFLPCLSENLSLHAINCPYLIRIQCLDQEDSGTFNWTKQWYPVASDIDMDPTKPHAIMLLGARSCLHTVLLCWSCDSL